MHPVPRAPTLSHLIQVYLSGCKDTPCTLIHYTVSSHPDLSRLFIFWQPLRSFHVVFSKPDCLASSTFCKTLRICQWPPPMLFLHASGAQSQPKQMPKIRLSIWKAFNTASLVAKNRWSLQSENVDILTGTARRPDRPTVWQTDRHVSPVFNLYHSPTELWEGNVFSRTCLSVCLFTRGGPLVTIAHDALDLAIQGPLPLYQTSPPVHFTGP